MTGYGRGECTSKGARITVELNTVNRKQVEVSLGLPSELGFIESDLRDMVLASVSRGRVNGRVALSIQVRAELCQLLSTKPKLGCTGGKWAGWLSC